MSEENKEVTQEAPAAQPAPATDRYAYKKKSKSAAPVEVDLPLPSGNIMRMQKPGRYSVIFGVGSLPTGLTGKAMASWEDKGVGNAPDDESIRATVEQSTDVEKLKLFASTLKVRDKVIELSVRPKMTMEDTGEPGTVWVQDMDDDDLEFLFRWVAAGGIVSPELESFRARAHAHAMGRSNGEQVQPEAERAFGT